MDSGTVFEIELPFQMGYSYARYVDISHIIGRVWDSSMLKVYNHTSGSPLEDVEFLKSVDLLFGPTLLVRKPTRRTTGWKVVGKFLMDDDYIVPNFKTTHRFPYIVEDESKIDLWLIVALGKSEEPMPYDRISHLEQPVLQGIDQIEARIVMEILRNRGEDPLKFYEWEELEDHIKRVYLRMINVPKYSDIPNLIRGVASE